MKNPFKPIIIFSLFCAILFLGIFYARKAFINQISREKKESISTSNNVTPESKIISSPGELAITLTEEDIKEQINNQANNIVTDLGVNINPINVVITGTLPKYLNQKFVIVFIPSVVNNQVDIQIVKAKIGFISAPKSLIEKTLDQVKKELEKKGNNKIKEIVLENNQITIKTRE